MWDELAAVSAMVRLVFSPMTCLAVPVLRWKMRDAHRTFCIPGGLLVPALAAALSLWLLSGITRTQALAGMGAIVAGALMYFLSRQLPSLTTSSTPTRTEP